MNTTTFENIETQTLQCFLTHQTIVYHFILYQDDYLYNGEDGLI